MPFAPRRLALLPERDVHAGIAVGVAIDVPLEAEVDERRVFDHEFTRRDRRIARRRDQRNSHE
jgi:hypothetical protein